MCTGYSWRPPVFVSIMIASLLISFGINMTMESLAKKANAADGAETAGSSLVVYEGPLLISAGVVVIVIGLVLGVRAYCRQRILTAQARERAAQEARALEEGPPPECVPRTLNDAQEAQEEEEDEQEQEEPDTEEEDLGDYVPDDDLLGGREDGTGSEDGGIIIPEIKPAEVRPSSLHRSDHGGDGSKVSRERETSPRRQKLLDLQPGQIPIPTFIRPLYGHSPDEGRPWTDSDSELSAIAKEELHGVINPGYRVCDLDTVDGYASEGRRRDTADGRDLLIADGKDGTLERIFYPTSSTNPGRLGNRKADTNNSNQGQERSKPKPRRKEESIIPQEAYNLTYAPRYERTTLPRAHPVTKPGQIRRKDVVRMDRHIKVFSDDAEYSSSSRPQARLSGLQPKATSSSKAYDGGYKSEGAFVYEVANIAAQVAQDDHPARLDRPSAPGPTHRRNTTGEKRRRKQPRRSGKGSRTSESSLEYTGSDRDLLLGEDVVFEEHNIPLGKKGNTRRGRDFLRTQYWQHSPNARSPHQGTPPGDNSSASSTSSLQCQSRTLDHRQLRQGLRYNYSEGVLLDARTLELRHQCHRRSHSGPSDTVTSARYVPLPEHSGTYRGSCARSHGFREAARDLSCRADGRDDWYEQLRDPKCRGRTLPLGFDGEYRRRVRSDGASPVYNARVSKAKHKHRRQPSGYSDDTGHRRRRQIDEISV